MPLSKPTLVLRLSSRRRLTPPNPLLLGVSPVSPARAVAPHRTPTTPAVVKEPALTSSTLVSRSTTQSLRAVPLGSPTSLTPQTLTATVIYTHTRKMTSILMIPRPRHPLCWYRRFQDLRSSQEDSAVRCQGPRCQRFGT